MWETTVILLDARVSRQHNPSGSLFQNRAKELLEYVRKQSAPYYGTDQDLARVLFIGPRTITRYIRYLKALGYIETPVSKVGLYGDHWLNRRKIIIVNGGR